MASLESLMSSPTGCGRPPQEIIDRGLQDGEMFEDMERKFLQTYLDKMEDILGGYMFRYYDEDFSQWMEHCGNVDRLPREDIIDIGDSDKFDDCVILGRSDNSYWYFWKHNSGRNDIGRCSVDKVSNAGEFCSIVKRWIEELLIDVIRYSPCEITGCIKTIPAASLYNMFFSSKTPVRKPIIL